MINLGEARFGNNVVGNAYLITSSEIETYPMIDQIIELFEKGRIGSKSTMWYSNIMRMDCQREDTNGKSIDNTLTGNRIFSNYSVQSGPASNAVVFIDNKLTNRTKIETAYSAFKGKKNYDLLLMRILLTMSLISNERKEKIVITPANFVTNSTPMNAAIKKLLNKSQDSAKNVFIKFVKEADS